MKIWQDEIFAPVLSIVRVKDLAEAIEVANAFTLLQMVLVFIQTVLQMFVSSVKQSMPVCLVLTSVSPLRWHSSHSRDIKIRSMVIFMQMVQMALSFIRERKWLRLDM